MAHKTIILGTAGHIDHGKTTLVKALTGVDTDRLKEEKERGITIELGFARLELPGGQSIGVVDVPGHEKFVKNMVAGASGMDLVAMVIAADEGPMPQTREHLEICQLLGVKMGLVVLTKADMVDEEWLELVTEDVKEFVAGTFLEGAPVVAVSAVTGQGLDRLLAVLDDLVSKVPERPPAGPYRLCIDRVFTKKGFGTVVTGTSISGTVSVGSDVLVYPKGLEAKIRGIQVHGADAESAKPGMRTALNLQGIEKSDLERGDVVATPGSLLPSYLLDLKYLHLSSNEKPLKYRAPVRLHVGTAEVIGRVLMAGDEMEAGAQGYIQLKLDAPVAVLPGDHYVLRSYSPVRTIGGGVVLNPVPRKRKRTRPDLWDEVKVLDRGSEEEVVLYHLRQVGVRGLAEAELAARTGIYGKALDKLLGRLLGGKKVVKVEGETRLLLHGGVYQELKDRICEIVGEYHRQQPMMHGLSREELRSRIFRQQKEGRLFQRLLNDLEREGLLVQEKEIVRLPDHRVRLGDEDKKARKAIAEAFKEAGFLPPSRADAVSRAGGGKAAEEIFDLMVREGELVRIKEGIYYHRDTMERLISMVTDFIRKNGEISVPQFRELAGGLSRKYMIPLLEYLDNQHITLRVGDVRKLRK